jgi:hypothetical protein
MVNFSAKITGHGTFDRPGSGRPLRKRRPMIRNNFEGPSPEISLRVLSAPDGFDTTEFTPYPLAPQCGISPYSMAAVVSQKTLPTIRVRITASAAGSASDETHFCDRRQAPGRPSGKRSGFVLRNRQSEAGRHHRRIRAHRSASKQHPVRLLRPSAPEMGRQSQRFVLDFHDEAGDDCHRTSGGRSDRDDSEPGSLMASLLAERAEICCGSSAPPQ